MSVPILNLLSKPANSMSSNGEVLDSSTTSGENKSDTSDGVSSFRTDFQSQREALNKKDVRQKEGSENVLMGNSLPQANATETSSQVTIIGLSETISGKFPADKSAPNRFEEIKFSGEFSAIQDLGKQGNIALLSTSGNDDRSLKEAGNNIISNPIDIENLPIDRIGVNTQALLKTSQVKNDTSNSNSNSNSSLVSSLSSMDIPKELGRPTNFASTQLEINIAEISSQPDNTIMMKALPIESDETSENLVLKNSSSEMNSLGNLLKGNLTKSEKLANDSRNVESSFVNAKQNLQSKELDNLVLKQEFGLNAKEAKFKSIRESDILSSQAVLSRTPETAISTHSSVHDNLGARALQPNTQSNLVASSLIQNGLPLNQEFSGNLALRIKWIYKQAMSSAEIMMDPEELGPMNIKMQNHKGETNIIFHVNNLQTKGMIEDNLEKLKDLLADQGINLGDTQIEHQQQEHSEKEAKTTNRSTNISDSEENQVSVAGDESEISSGLLDTYI